MLENSRQALELAWRQGADRVEIDVRATRDGKLLVLHDPTLNRTTTGQGRVSRFNWEDLSTIRLSNGEPLLLLEEALDLLRGRTQVYLEVKDPVAAPGVARAVQGLEGVIVSSRDPGTLAQLAAEAPHVSTSLLVRDLDAPVERAVRAGVDYLHLCWERLSDPVGKVSRTLMNEVREAGLGLILWREERPAQLRRIGRLSGVHGVCTNVPDRARLILGLPPGIQPRPLAPGGGDGKIKGELGRSATTLPVTKHRHPVGEGGDSGEYCLNLTKKHD